MEEKTIIINEEYLYKMIKYYYKKHEDKDINFYKDLKIMNNDLVLHLYLIKDNEQLLITVDDLNVIFKEYFDYCDLEYIGFKYVGYIRIAGYYTSKDTPIFQGVQLSYKNKSYNRRLSIC